MEESKADARKISVFHPLSFIRLLRGYLFAGILVILPISLTVWILLTLLNIVDKRVIPYFYRFVSPPHEQYLELPGVGLVLLLLSLILLGFLSSIFFRGPILKKIENMIFKLPLVGKIYSTIHQIAYAVFSEDAKAFREVVLIEYPRRGIWSLGFVTGIPKGDVQTKTVEDVVNVFLPTTPNPTSGFLLFVPSHEVIPVSMTPDEALRFIISGGVLASEKEEIEKK